MRLAPLTLLLVLALAPVAAPAQDTAPTPVTSLVMVPAGEFTMGRPGDEDLPLHRVRLDAFLIDEHEVTNAQYQAFCAATGADLPIFWGLDRFRCGEQWPDHPIVGVSHAQAQKYAAWVGKRLPTEAEWEYAARAGGGFKYGEFDKLLPEHANFKASEHKTPAPVKSYPPNAFGLYDMIGNVREWVADYYGGWIPAESLVPEGEDPDLSGVVPLVDPTGPVDGRWRVLKGGGWFSGAMCNPVYVRNHLPTHWCDFNVGFRCARDVDPGE